MKAINFLISFRLFCLFTFLIVSVELSAQCVGSTSTIYIPRNIGCSYGTGGNAQWDGAVGGTISDPGGTNSSFTVTWTTTGTFRLKRTFPVGCFGTPLVSSYYTITASPAAPTAAQVNQTPGCGQVTLNYTGGVYDTYWQLTSTGTDESYRTTRNVVAPLTYYARIKGSGGCWSTARSIAVSSIPPAPTGGTLSGGGTYFATVNKTLSLSGHSGTIKEYRYKENAGSDVIVSNTSTTLPVSFINNTSSAVSRQYWAVLQINSCLSNSASTTITLNPLSAPSMTVCVGSTTELSISRSIGCAYGTGSNATFVSATGGSINDPGGSNSTFSVAWSTAGVYALKRTFPSQCGTEELISQTIQVVDKPATPPSPSIVSSCGYPVLGYPGSPPAGTNWHWQGHNSNGYTENAVPNFNAETPGTYYLRARNTAGCWSVLSTAITIRIDNFTTLVPPKINYTCTQGGTSLILSTDQTADRWFETSTSTSALSTTNSLATTLTPKTLYLQRTNSAYCLVRVPYHIDATSALKCASYLSQVKTIVPMHAVTTVVGTTTTNESAAYFDGLGRDIQNVVKGASPLGQDLVQSMEYDGVGREAIRYLPYTMGNTGAFKSNFKGKDDAQYRTAGNQQFHFYQATPDIAIDDNPYTQTEFEPSPLNRPLKQFGAGAAWHTNNKANQTEYLINQHSTGTSATAEAIIAWIISGVPVRSPAIPAVVETGGYYATGQLQIKSSKDEQGNQVREYTDKQGRIILKKVQAAASTNLNSPTEWALTYYVYDEFDNLRFVLPPELSKLLHTNGDIPTILTELARWAFQYTYDGRRRMITKQVPGADPVYMVYDNRDRLVMTQDGQQRLTNKWTYTKYDQLNRPIITGIYTHGSPVSQSVMSGLISTSIFHEAYNGVSGTHGYTSTSGYFPSTSATPLIVTYYDNYLFRSMTTGLSYITNDYTSQPAENTAVKGQVTGTKVNVLGSSDYLYSAIYYDAKYRVVQTISRNIRNATDRISNKYDFPGRVIETVSTHNNGTTSYTTKRRMEYDHASRLKKVFHKFSTEPEILLVENVYNELGQLVTKKQHSRNSGSTFAQLTDYRYNIRGWLEKVNDPDAPEATDLFSMQLNYNNPTANGGAAQFNGNISETRWSSAGMDKQSYGYNYDAMNRLKEANYFNAIKPIENGRYDEKLIGPGNTSGYDLNGNIRYLTRNGKRAVTPQGTFDNLTYNYIGNQLKIVNDVIADHANEEGFKELTEKTFNVNNTDAQNEYAYDKNGNMTKDDNKGITAITYNHLNLPQQVNKGATDYVVYTYDATGRKLKQQVYGSAAKTTEYLGEFIYENNALQYILHEDGRIVADNSPGAPRPWEYQYHLKDHLGNVRVGFSEKTTTTINTATLENATQTTEQATFRNYGNRSALSLFNKTQGGTYSQVLNGGNNNQIGLAKSFAVNPGDVFDLEVYGKYEQPTATGNNLNTLFSALVSAFTLNPTGGPGLEGQQAHTAFNSLFGGGPAITTGEWEDDNAPKAYLNYILFDQNFALVDMGWDQISYSAKQVGVSPVVAHDLMSLHVKVKQQGYLYIYLSNENPTMSNVYFDDFVIKRSTAVEQVANYYAFGLAQNSNGFERHGGVKNPLLYNGKELQDELNLGWLDYGARMYDPAIARWSAIDPLAEQYWGLAPYNYVANNPINALDPNGEEIVIVGDGEYMIAALKAILQIGRSKVGAQMIDRLSSSKNRVIIRNGDKNSEKIGEDQNGTKTSYVTWNPSIKESEGKKRSPFIGLAHELRHSDQNFAGMQDEQIYDSNKPFVDSELYSEGNTVNFKEIEAVHFENSIRVTMGEEPRRTYDGLDADVSNDQKTFIENYNVATGRYTIPNTRNYKADWNKRYVLFWARILNNFKKGPSDIGSYSKRSATRKSGIDPSYDFRKESKSSVIKY